MHHSHKTLLALTLSALVIFTGCSSTAQSNSNKTSFQGMIEAEDVDINAKIPGKVVEVKAEEGPTIQEGDIFASVDAADISAQREGLVAQADAAKAATDAAQGQLGAAQATYEKATHGLRTEEIAKAQANYDILKKSYDRTKALFDANAASQSTLDGIETQLDVANQDLSMAKEGARKEDIAVAKATVSAAHSNVVAAQGKYQQALAGIQQIDANLKDTSIHAPMAGIVSMVNVKNGELVSSGMSLGTITDLNDIWVEIQTDETQLSKFKEGQTLSVQIPAYKDKTFSGKVVRINAKPDYAVKKASNENGDFDLVTYGIKIKLENPDHLLRPGMTAFVSLLK